jgi:hypothetical protein
MTGQIHNIQGDVISPNELKDQTGKYLTGFVNVTGNVLLSSRNLKQLPVKFGTVGGSFICKHNELTSLQGAPSTVGGSFFCDDNPLTSLEGVPSTISGFFYCSSNKLTSLQGIHKVFKKIDRLYIDNSPINTGGIGLVLIEGLTNVTSRLPAFKIIKKYLGQGKPGLLRCQEELIDAGYEEFAKL